MSVRLLREMHELLLSGVRGQHRRPGELRTSPVWIGGNTRPTAHSAIDALVERGDLHEVTGRERGRIYEAPRIFDAVYGPVDIGEPSPDPQLRLDLGPRS